MIVGVAKESVAGETRVALVPSVVPQIVKLGVDVVIEREAGLNAGYRDEEFVAKGAKIVSRSEALAADVILAITGPNLTDASSDAMTSLKSGQVVIAMTDPLGSPQTIQSLAARGVTGFSLELVPRTTRAQAMDVLSSMATIAGYKAVLLAAVRLPRMFPMFMTAAGTVKAARVLVMGAGVAGLQAIATAKRLGGIVYAYDVRPAVKEQVESLGGKFVDLGLDTAGAEDKGGYAKEQSTEFLEKQRAALTKVIAESDVVITTAAIPGKRSPILVTGEMVKAMQPGSVIIDLGAERGGNCELTEPGKDTVKHGVTIYGPVNLTATVPYHASQMFSKNVATFLKLLIKNGALAINLADDIVEASLVCQGGEVTAPRVRDLLGLPPLPKAA